MNQYVTQGGIKIARELHQFIEQEVLPGLELDADQYWANLETLLNEFGPVSYTHLTLPTNREV